MIEAFLHQISFFFNFVYLELQIQGSYRGGDSGWGKKFKFLSSLPHANLHLLNFWKGYVSNTAAYAWPLHKAMLHHWAMARAYGNAFCQ